MAWNKAPDLTRAAREAFGDPAVVAHRRGGQYFLDDSPFGRIEILKIREGFLVAAERPPQRRFGPPRLSRELEAHLEQNELEPVVTVRTRRPAKALEELVRLSEVGAGESGGGESGGGDWSPLLLPLSTSRRLVGEHRVEVGADLEAVLDARAMDDPLPLLSGPPGVGRRAVAGDLARRSSLVPVELPLGRVLVPDRVLQSPLEICIDTLMEGARAMGDRDLLVVTEVELLLDLEARGRVEAVRELARLDRVVLVSAVGISGFLSLPVQGLFRLEDCEELISEEVGDADLVGPALDMVVAAARMPELGVIPSRLLFVLRLAMAMPREESGPLTPDDLARAVRLAGCAWRIS